MRTVVNGEMVQAYCRHCRGWKPLARISELSSAGTTAMVRWSAERTRTATGSQHWYWNASAGTWKPMCKACELERKRQRRAQQGGTRQTRGRIFGIEMELTGPDDRTVINTLIAAGIAMDARNVSTRRAISYQATNTAEHVWTLKRDGSVSGYGLELVSPKLRGAAGYAEVERVCQALNSAGATVDRSTGLHVHHDFRRQTIEQTRTQLLAFVERQDLISELVAPSRRNNAYCSLWSQRHIDALRAVTQLAQVQYIGPRGAINATAYGRHGSVEIRFHGGTTNARKVLAWVRFGQALFAAALAGADVSTTDTEQMLQGLMAHGLTTADVATLLRFRRVGETRQQIEAMLREAQEMLEEVA